MAKAVRGIDFTIHRVARYDAELASLVPLDTPRGLSGPNTTEFDGLPGKVRMSHAGPFPAVSTRAEGEETVFVPKRLGVYLIWATWRDDGKGALNGPPVVLTVAPPLDEKGRPVVKKEWLEEDD